MISDQKSFSWTSTHAYALAYSLCILFLHLYVLNFVWADRAKFSSPPETAKESYICLKRVKELYLPYKIARSLFTNFNVKWPFYWRGT